jgi:hypothetical protein
MVGRTIHPTSKSRICRMQSLRATLHTRTVPSRLALRKHQSNARSERKKKKKKMKKKKKKKKKKKMMMKKKVKKKKKKGCI